MVSAFVTRLEQVLSISLLADPAGRPAAVPAALAAVADDAAPLRGPLAVLLVLAPPGVLGVLGVQGRSPREAPEEPALRPLRRPGRRAAQPADPREEAVHPLAVVYSSHYLDTILLITLMKPLTLGEARPCGSAASLAQQVNCSSSPARLTFSLGRAIWQLIALNQKV